MRKILLIIRREYITRVRNKTFLLSTFLMPLMFVVIIGAVIFITVKSVKKETIAVVDKEGTLKEFLQSGSKIKFEFLPAADTSWLDKGYSALLLAPQNGMNHTDRFKIYSRKNLSIVSEESIRNKINEAIETRLITSMGSISRATYDSIKHQAQETGLDNLVLEAGAGVKEGNSGVAYGVGYFAGFLIYITLFLYGVMVMRGVMEEKTNRIAEVVVSSVRPVQLMMGKIIGIGAVGVTQFILWIVLIMTLTSAMNAMIPHDIMAQVNDANHNMPGGGGMSAQSNDAVMAFAKAQATLSSVNWPLIIGCFLFYFVFGYLFYAALFAAVGSAVNEDPQDAQSLMFPITLPIILAIIIMMNAITQPESSLATWASIIPFFSPIVMMARLPFGVPGTVPYWQLGLSMLSLIAGFLLVTWLSAKIYRTGILLYGKKVTLKEMWKWTLRKA